MGESKVKLVILITIMRTFEKDKEKTKKKKEHSFTLMDIEEKLCDLYSSV